MNSLEKKECVDTTTVYHLKRPSLIDEIRWSLEHKMQSYELSRCPFDAERDVGLLDEQRLHDKINVYLNPSPWIIICDSWKLRFGAKIAACMAIAGINPKLTEVQRNLLTINNHSVDDPNPRRGIDAYIRLLGLRTETLFESIDKQLKDLQDDCTGFRPNAGPEGAGIYGEKRPDCAASTVFKLRLINANFQMPSDCIEVIQKGATELQRSGKYLEFADLAAVLRILNAPLELTLSDWENLHVGLRKAQLMLEKDEFCAAICFAQMIASMTILAAQHVEVPSGGGLIIDGRKIPATTTL